MKNLFILPNLQKEASLPFAEELLRLSRNAGGESSLFLASEEENYPAAADIPEAAELIVAIGGDGTVIRAAAAFISRGLPVLGINTGHVGFLTGSEAEAPEQVFSALCGGRFREEQRMLLSFSWLRRGELLREGIAFNDVTVRGLDPAHALSFSLSVSGEEVYSCTADGLIVSSPTGSTAYNLSAGGPLCLPEAEVLLCTPLNPHSFLQRSLVLPPDSLVSVKLSGNRTNDAGICFDSFFLEGLAAGDEVLVKKHDRKVRLLSLRSGSYFDTLRNKFRF